MALFATLPAGSGKISPLFPNLVLRWDVDGLGLVFEDPSTNFLLVWNGTDQNIRIQYSPGLFTQVLVKHTGELVHPGPQTWNFKSYPAGLGYAWEIDRYPTSASPYGFPPSYLKGGGAESQWSRDEAYDTNQTSDVRRFLTWPPLRGMRWNPSTTKQAEAFQATMEWCQTQLRRPLAHISTPFVPFLNVDEYSACFELNSGAGNYWNADFVKISGVPDFQHSVVAVPDLDGVTQNWNAFEPAHNADTAQFALACADHPLGVCLIWLLFSWMVQGMPPGTTNPFGNYSYPWGQERSVFWCLQIFLHAYLVGIEWADPNLIRDWCGGLKTNGHGNGGIGWRPREALRWWTDVFVGPEYGGIGGLKARFMWLNDAPFASDGHHQPYMAPGNDFTFNGRDYQRLFGSMKAFHRHMVVWIAKELIRANDYIHTLDATENLFDSARVSELTRWARQFSQYVIDTQFIDDWGGSAKGAFRQRGHVFELGVAEKGFESLAALEAGITQAIGEDCAVDVNGTCVAPGTVFCGNPNTCGQWVYPGTNAQSADHLFAVQFSRWELGVGLWHIMAGRVSGDTEGHETGIPAYALAFGYDATLQACMDQYAGDVGDVDKAPDHYEVVWRAKEKSGSTDLPLGTIQFSTKLAGITVGNPTGIALGTIKLAPKFAGLTIGAPSGPVLGTIKFSTKFAGLTVSDQGATYLQLGTIKLAPAFAGLTVHTRDNPDEGPPDTGGGTTDDGGVPPPEEPPPPPIDGGSIDDDRLGRSLRGPRIPAGLFVGDEGLRLGPDQ